MAIIKQAEIKILSVIENLGADGLPEGDAERNESLATGYFHITDGVTFATYTEQTEGGDISSEVRVEQDGVRVIRRGAIESEMYFSEGVTHSSLYKVGPYAFDAEISTRKIRLELSEDGGRVDMFYNMKIGGAEKSARMKIWILTDSRQN